MNQSENAYQFFFESLESKNQIKLSEYQGKVILIVNTASKCGFTGQYKELESLYQKYKDQGFVIIAIPSGDFAAQEFNTDTEIAQFCELNFGVSFPITSKYNVTGEDAHPFYKWVKSQLGFWSAPKWNFYKYLIDGEGKLIKSFSSFTSPDSASLTTVIEKFLT